MDESEGSFHDASKIMEGDASDPHPGDVDNLQNANSGISGRQSKQGDCPGSRSADCTARREATYKVRLARRSRFRLLPRTGNRRTSLVETAASRRRQRRCPTRSCCRSR